MTKIIMFVSFVVMIISRFVIAVQYNRMPIYKMYRVSLGLEDDDTSIVVHIIFNISFFVFIGSLLLYIYFLIP